MAYTRKKIRAFTIVTPRFKAIITPGEEGGHRCPPGVMLVPVKPEIVKVLEVQDPAEIGKSAGDSVEVQTPCGVKGYEIIDVRYE